MNIIRLALHRSIPGYSKTAGTAQTKLIVGILQENQWEHYKYMKLNVPNDKQVPRVRVRKASKPRFCGKKIGEKIEHMDWDIGKDQELPIIGHRSDWYFNKWKDGSSVWRSWLTSFSIVWCSFYGTVYISFRFRTQHYKTASGLWCDN